ncbi:helix-turn-helix transcriptional regulator [Eggerthella sinensis]|uniref:helix-turn-helix transcriptional regulator n=1 Tax=Eggerthella sinensis TaxID=242230 RepID=UPI002FD83EAE
MPTRRSRARTPRTTQAAPRANPRPSSATTTWYSRCRKLPRARGADDQPSPSRIIRLLHRIIRRGLFLSPPSYMQVNRPPLPPVPVRFRWQTRSSAGIIEPGEDARGELQHGSQGSSHHHKRRLRRRHRVRRSQPAVRRLRPAPGVGVRRDVRHVLHLRHADLHHRHVRQPRLASLPHIHRGVRPVPAVRRHHRSTAAAHLHLEEDARDGFAAHVRGHAPAAGAGTAQRTGNRSGFGRDDGHRLRHSHPVLGHGVRTVRQRLHRAQLIHRHLHRHRRVRRRPALRTLPHRRHPHRNHSPARAGHPVEQNAAALLRAQRSAHLQAAAREPHEVLPAVRPARVRVRRGAGHAAANVHPVHRARIERGRPNPHAAGRGMRNRDHPRHHRGPGRRRQMEPLLPPAHPLHRGHAVLPAAVGDERQHVFQHVPRGGVPVLRGAHVDLLRRAGAALPSVAHLRVRPRARHAGPGGARRVAVSHRGGELGAPAALRRAGRHRHRAPYYGVRLRAAAARARNRGHRGAVPARESRVGRTERPGTALMPLRPAADDGASASETTAPQPEAAREPLLVARSSTSRDEADGRKGGGRFRAKCETVANTYLLSRRETEIMFFLAKGHNAAYIQEKLYISEGTAKTHIRHVYKKTNVHSQQELMRLVESAEAAE